MRLLMTIFAFGLVLAAPVTVNAAPAERIQVAQSANSLNDAVEQVRRQYPNGRIISANTKVSGDREVYEVRVMVDGKVKTVTVRGRKRG